MKTQAIEGAKKYAKERETSLSLLVESYFTGLDIPKKRKKITERSGLKGLLKLPKNFDYKKAYGDYLMKKYLH